MPFCLIELHVREKQIQLFLLFFSRIGRRRIRLQEYRPVCPRADPPEGMQIRLKKTGGTTALPSAGAEAAAGCSGRPSCRNERQGVPYCNDVS